jgi:hypothetical protein
LLQEPVFLGERGKKSQGLQWKTETSVNVRSIDQIMLIGSDITEIIPLQMYSSKTVNQTLYLEVLKH